MLRSIALAAGFLLSVSAVSFGETTAKLENSHLCCASCVKDATKAVESAGAKAACDSKTGTVTVTAADAATAQKAMDALAAAGFFGKPTGATIKDDAGAPAGKVKSLSVTTHNCCKKCTTAINKVVASVDGAKGEATPKVDTFTVTGDFDAAALVKAFNDAGFSVKTASK